MGGFLFWGIISVGAAGLRKERGGPKIRSAGPEVFGSETTGTIAGNEVGDACTATHSRGSLEQR